jgi:predicted Zn-dependent protease
MKDYFYAVTDALQAQLRGEEVLLLGLDGEESDFLRLNRGRVRQAGSVARRSLSVDLIEGECHASARMDLAGGLQQDLPQLQFLLKHLREQRARLPADPYLNYATDGPSGEREVEPALPARAEALEAITATSQGLDLVGIWAAGSLHSGFASSLGQRNWYSRASFNFDWSCYHAGDKAVKGAYAGLCWDPAELALRMQAVRSDLEVMARPARSIEPGRYRVYLAPRALQEILDMMAWGGFGLKSQRTGQSPLMRMLTEGQRLARVIEISEFHGRGLEPLFTPQGFAKPERVTLIEQGAYQYSLADPRSAREYGAEANAANEWPQSLDMAAGTLARDEILDALDTGLYVNNLWYLNYSDRNHARITGMTRFACFWVQESKITAPVNVMRFDDSIYSMLGEALVGLSRSRELLLDPGSYGGRSSRSCELPGALIEAMTFTL